MEQPIHSIQYTPKESLCKPAFSIFSLRVTIIKKEPSSSINYKVKICTNLGQAGRIRSQIIQRVEEGFSHQRDFYDIPLRYDSKTGQYCLDYLLDQIGYFQWKLWVGSEDSRNPWIYWAPGSNHGISVFPASYKRGNAIYCAFLRQFREERNTSKGETHDIQDRVDELEKIGCTVIQPSGKFDEFKKRLRFIIKDLGMKTIHLLPINPVPQSYGRMGRYGSPYASLDFYAIDPVYATFDRFRTIEEQFIDLTSTVHCLDGKVMLDMAINHTGWGSRISSVHSIWQVRKSDGEFVSPGAWGKIWEDLVELDHSRKDLWIYLAEMFIIWCRRGVDGFRLDAGYMVPLSLWQYIIARVREEFPETFFLLEGLGGAMECTRELLQEGMINSAYSELFQNYSKDEIINYLRHANRVSSQEGILVHYAETHDNNRLATKGRSYALMRLCLSAFTSYYGNWGFTNGVEWLADEKIDVHGNGALNWDSQDNIVSEISRINRILDRNPCFWLNDNIEVIDTPWPNICTFYRAYKSRRNFILVIVNLDCENSASISLLLDELGIDPPFSYPFEAVDILGDSTYRMDGRGLILDITQGQVLVLRFQELGKPYELFLLNSEKRPIDEIDTVYRIMLQYYDRHEVAQIDQEMLLSFWNPYRGLIAYAATHPFDAFFNPDFKEEITQLHQFLLEEYSEVWEFTNKNKDFLLESHKWLITSTELAASVFLNDKRIETVNGDDGCDWAIFPPIEEHRRSQLTFHWVDILNGKINRRWENAYYPVYSLPDYKGFKREMEDFHLTLNQSDILNDWMCFILANGRGSFVKTPLVPGEVHSKYDALLMANFSHDYPEDRVVLVKCSYDSLLINDRIYRLDARDCVQFKRYPVPTWRFIIEDYDARFVLTKQIHLVRDENTVLIQYRCIEATEEILLKVEFCLEWRSYHYHSSAVYLEGKGEKPFTVIDDKTGFYYHPYEEERLFVSTGRGQFATQPQWIKDIGHPMDATRGQESSGDAFSPGYFLETMTEGENIDFLLTTERDSSHRNFDSQVSGEARRQHELFRRMPLALRDDPIAKSFMLALDQFVVKRGRGFTVIAGYPWFLDWGRDTLICVPGLIAAGFNNEVAGILTELAQFTRDGMVPNTIYGESAGNYDTTDAPLWFIEAVRCYVEGAIEDYNFLSKPLRADGTTMLAVLQGIVEDFARGTGNNIRLDEETGLIFSPSHFTWMDTQHPAGTPREGYPVEIQGLWINGLRFLANNIDSEDTKERYLSWAAQAEESLWALYWLDDKQYFADGIWSSNGARAQGSIKDTSLRPNQLILLYLNLVPRDRARLMLREIQKELVIPAAIRSLADRHIEEPLYIRTLSGELLSDPHYPYQGEYKGDEDTSRKAAYHNGTAWLWLYPYFVEAFAFAYGDNIESVRRALNFLAPSVRLLRKGAVGSLEEIRDGDYPHTPRGCFAQAWSVAELMRVYLKLRLREIELTKEGE
ncbi:MAG: amylo-alpha-1,6-glucosidase [Spirochaetota bacterium]|nr:amylo-alpha-1,6-glucosidase [Spirochaetota bacterium]